MTSGYEICLNAKLYSLDQFAKGHVVIGRGKENNQLIAFPKNELDAWQKMDLNLDLDIDKIAKQVKDYQSPDPDFAKKFYALMRHIVTRRNEPGTIGKLLIKIGLKSEVTEKEIDAKVKELVGEKIFKRQSELPPAEKPKPKIAPAPPKTTPQGRITGAKALMQVRTKQGRISQKDGIENLGTSCWLNSILQLLRTTDFLSSIIEKGPDNEEKQKKELRQALTSAVLRLRLREPLETKDLRNLRRLICREYNIQNPKDEQDPQEMLGKLRDTFGKPKPMEVKTWREYKGEKAHYWSHDEKPFKGYNITLFPRKEGESIQTLTRMTYLEVPKENLQQQVNFIVKDKDGKVITKLGNEQYHQEAIAFIEKNLRIKNPSELQIHSVQAQKIQDDYPGSTVEVAKLTRQARKIVTPSPYLEIALNKFDIQNMKIDQKLILGQKTEKNPPQYTLECAICRLGEQEITGEAGGHIYYMVHDQNKKRWIRFNDREVEQLSEADAQIELNGNAYVCYYKKIEAKK
jgi:hypothetical protein